MDENTENKIKESFAKTLISLKSKSPTDFSLKVLQDEVVKDYLLALFFKRDGGVQDSIVLARGNKEKIEEAEKLISELLAAIPFEVTEQILQL